jgi:CheY-like chemotaxis protein
MALHAKLSPPQRVEAENDVRLALLQALSGVLLALGFVVTWLQLGQARDQFNRNLEQSQHQLEQNGTQHTIAQTGQLAERFSRAMEQLGNDSPDVRIGGIHGLEGLLVDLGDNSTAGVQLTAYQRADRRAIIEILTAYVRNHESWDPAVAKPASNTQVQDLGVRAPDIQAVMSILGRHAQAVRDTGVFLARTNLSGLRRAAPVVTTRAAPISTASTSPNATLTGQISSRPA